VLGLVKGYIAEKQNADECIKSLENRNETLIKETERLRARVQEFEDTRGEIVQREQDLVHQQRTLELSVDDATKGTQCLYAGFSLIMMTVNIVITTTIIKQL